MMDDSELRRNADFLQIAMEQMDADSIEHDFVSDVYSNLIEAADE